ncbi:hypothetical protein [Frondihabitans australicus]|uniref:Cell envelope-related Asp23 family protein n=1 Tax=Frondihabitans australicus TaxID=386892 RepID=A0A495ILP4_9MICO|nr:hypothetical protein [Frondihabitans australicus]RKR76086.1 hypothetical protein C8E83_3251 [Frondihabitans australicus]
MSDDTVTLERISDYLDAGRLPYDPAIEDDPENQAQLVALARLRSLSARLVEDDADAVPAPDSGWLSGVMERVRREARSGRDLPIAGDDPRAVLQVTEGAVRGLIREAGDGVHGAIVISCVLRGDVSTIGAPVRVEVTISALRGEFVPAMADEVRAAVGLRLAAQTELAVEAIDIVVGDVHLLADGGRP